MRNTSKIVFATVVIFAAGVVTGGLLVSYANRSHNQRNAKATSASRPNWQPTPREVIQRDQRELRPILDQQRMDFILRTARELNLTPEQRERIEKVVREGQERSKLLWEKAAPELRKNLQEVREQIRAELKPEQLKKFEQLQKQMQSRQSEAGAGQGQGTTTGRGNPESRRSGRGLNPPAEQPESSLMPVPAPADKR